MRQINFKIGDILTVTIEKLSNLGYGIGRVDGYLFFVPNSCPEDKLSVKVLKLNKNYGFAEILEILSPSPYRVEPLCKMQKICGSCHFQFIENNAQLKYKKEIVSDAFRSVLSDNSIIRDVIPSPKVYEYRCKIQYTITQTKKSKRILAGYYKTGTHELVNIKCCPIQPDCCDKIIEYIREKAPIYSVTGYDETSHSGDLRHVVIRTSANFNESLIILVVNNPSNKDKYKNFANAIYNELPNIAGVGINFNDKKTNLILGNKTEIVAGKSYVNELLCAKTFKIEAKTFFQVNPYCADEIFKYIKSYISENFSAPSVLDAYAGISAFGICMSDIASEVTSVEEVRESVNLAKQIINENNINNVNPVCSDAGTYFEKLLKDNKQFDVTILDPPRKGCTEKSLEYAIKLTKKKIIYVSCNPSTLARDIAFLQSKGLTVDSVQPFDMFPHTYHVENVAIISVKNTGN